jgi:type I restriction enzyme S subunit
MVTDTATLKGYRKTDIGIIPDDWVIKPLGELFVFRGGFTASREQLSDEGHCYLHYGDIHKSSKSYIDVSDEYAEIPKLNVPINHISQKFLLNDGDVVFVDVSEDDEGASKHIVVRNPKKINYISGLHTIIAKSKDDALDNTYKQYCFQTRNVKKQVTIQIPRYLINHSMPEDIQNPHLCN